MIRIMRSTSHSIGMVNDDKNSGKQNNGSDKNENEGSNKKDDTGSNGDQVTFLAVSSKVSPPFSHLMNSTCFSCT
jgi:hypothetical protein